MNQTRGVLFQKHTARNILIRRYAADLCKSQMRLRTPADPDFCAAQSRSQVLPPLAVVAALIWVDRKVWTYCRTKL